jgi:hypothetical protein
MPFCLKSENLTNDTLDFDNLKVSETEKRSDMDEVEKECCNAYNVVLDE